MKSLYETILNDNPRTKFDETVEEIMSSCNSAIVNDVNKLLTKYTLSIERSKHIKTLVLGDWNPGAGFMNSLLNVIQKHGQAISQDNAIEVKDVKYKGLTMYLKPEAFKNDCIVVCTSGDNKGNRVSEIRIAYGDYVLRFNNSVRRDRVALTDIRDYPCSSNPIGVSVPEFAGDDATYFHSAYSLNNNDLIKLITGLAGFKG